MRCLEAEGNRLLIYRRKSIAGSNPAAYDMVEPVRFRPTQKVVIGSNPAAYEIKNRTQELVMG